MHGNRGNIHNTRTVAFSAAVVGTVVVASLLALPASLVFPTSFVSSTPVSAWWEEGRQLYVSGVPSWHAAVLCAAANAQMYAYVLNIGPSAGHGSATRFGNVRKKHQSVASKRSQLRQRGQGANLPH